MDSIARWEDQLRTFFRHKKAINGKKDTFLDERVHKNIWKLLENCLGNLQG
jgi:hypothetical protein